MITIIITIKL